MILLFIIVCFIAFLIAPCQLGWGVSSANLWGAFSYPFMHANWLHLGINIFSLLIMYNPIRKIYSERFNSASSPLFFIPIYLGAVLAGAMTAGDVTTVGASGMVFFLLGELLILRPTLKQLRNYIYVALSVVISMFYGNSNIKLHIVAFILGCLYIIIRIAYDDRRIKYSE